MVVESIHTQIPRETPVRPTLEQSELVEQLRHRNIYDILRTPGINRRDIEDYLAGQWKLFQNQIRQDYEVCAGEATCPAPHLVDFANHDVSMELTSQDQQFFRQEQRQLQNYQPVVDGAKGVAFRAKAMTQDFGGAPGSTAPGPGQEVAAIAEEALQDWERFFSELQEKMLDAQMFQQLQATTEEENRRIQRIFALVMSGHAEAEFLLIAATKLNMAQNGILFSWKGKKIMRLNEQMNTFAKELFKMDPNDQGYFKELQMSQAQTRSGSTQMQMEMMDIQKYAQNVTAAIEFASSGSRTIAQSRQTITQAIAAR